MPGTNHGALLFVASDFANNLDGLRDLIFKIGSLGRITGVSSVYKRYLEFNVENFNSELVMALQMEVAIEHQELHQMLPMLSPGISLLAFDQEVHLYPGKNLPHPDLHADSLTLRCAAEAWGTYEHPVLGQTLNEIVRSDVTMERIEFFAQGRQVLEPFVGD